MSEATLDAAVGRAREFRRMVAISAGLHVALSVFAVTSLPSWNDHELPAGPNITLITPEELSARLGSVAPPSRPTPQPAEAKPEPVAEPEPPPPPTEQVVIPEDTHRKPAEPKPKPKPATPRDPETRPRPSPADEEQVDLEDLLDEERILSGTLPGEAPRDAKPLVVPGAGGTGAPLSAEVAAWHQKVRAHVRRTLSLPPGFRGKALKTRVTLTLTGSGNLLGYEVDEGSGNPWYDDQIDRYLADQTSLPAPPEAGEWAFIFDGDL
jgi:colicin import membrane protein